MVSGWRLSSAEMTRERTVQAKEQVAMPAAVVWSMQFPAVSQYSWVSSQGAGRTPARKERDIRRTQKADPVMPVIVATCLEAKWKLT